MKLTLKQAVDKKQEIVNKLRRLNEQVQNNNCVETSKVSKVLPKTEDVDITKLLNDIKAGNENLDTLKYLILKANFEGGVQNKIYRLRTLITERSNLQALSRKIIEDEDHTSIVSKEKLDAKISETTPEINKLQVELNAFNSKTTIEFIPKTT